MASPAYRMPTPTLRRKPSTIHRYAAANRPLPPLPPTHHGHHDREDDNDNDRKNEDDRTSNDGKNDDRKNDDRKNDDRKNDDRKNDDRNDARKNDHRNDHRKNNDRNDDRKNNDQNHDQNVDHEPPPRYASTTPSTRYADSPFSHAATVSSASSYSPAGFRPSPRAKLTKQRPPPPSSTSTRRPSLASAPPSIPPELAHLNVDHRPPSSAPPARPSRVGIPSLHTDGAGPTPSPVVQTRLPKLSTSHHKRSSSSQDHRSTISSATTSTTATFSPSPHTPSSRASPFSRTSPSPCLPSPYASTTPDPTTVHRKDSPAVKSSRFAFLTRGKSKDASSTTPAKPKRATKGPAAGTGHEGYGRFGFRGRGGSAASSGARSSSVASSTSGEAVEGRKGSAASSSAGVTSSRKSSRAASPVVGVSDGTSGGAASSSKSGVNKNAANSVDTTPSNRKRSSLVGTRKDSATSSTAPAPSTGRKSTIASVTVPAASTGSRKSSVASSSSAAPSSHHRKAAATATSRKGSLASSDADHSDLDDFLRERLTPVVLRGSGGGGRAAPRDDTDASDHSRVPSMLAPSSAPTSQTSSWNGPGGGGGPERSSSLHCTSTWSSTAASSVSRRPSDGSEDAVAAAAASVHPALRTLYPPTAAVTAPRPHPIHTNLPPALDAPRSDDTKFSLDSPRDGVCLSAEGHWLRPSAADRKASFWQRSRGGGGGDVYDHVGALADGNGVDWEEVERIAREDEDSDDAPQGLGLGVSPEAARRWGRRGEHVSPYAGHTPRHGSTPPPALLRCTLPQVEHNFHTPEMAYSPSFDCRTPPTTYHSLQPPHAGRRTPRLSPVGRIPAVVSQRDRDRKLSDHSFSRPFASSHPRPPVIVKPPGSLYSSIREIASPDLAAGGDRRSFDPPAPPLSVSTAGTTTTCCSCHAPRRAFSNARASVTDLVFAGADLLAFPRRPSHHHRDRDQHGRRRHAAATPPSADDDVWSEYNDLLDEVRWSPRIAPQRPLPPTPL